VKREKQARGLAQPPFSAIAHHGPADLAGGGKPDADSGAVVTAIAGLDDDTALGAGRAFSGGQKVRTLLQMLNVRDGFGQAETSLD
jgi:hypothetical protein